MESIILPLRLIPSLALAIGPSWVAFGRRWPSKVQKGHVLRLILHRFIPTIMQLATSNGRQQGLIGNRYSNTSCIYTWLSIFLLFLLLVIGVIIIKMTYEYSVTILRGLVNVINDWPKHTLSSITSSKNASISLSSLCGPLSYYVVGEVARLGDLGRWIYRKWMVYCQHVFHHSCGPEHVSHQKKRDRETEIDRLIAITIAIAIPIELLSKLPCH